MTQQAYAVLVLTSEKPLDGKGIMTKLQDTNLGDDVSVLPCGFADPQVVPMIQDRINLTTFQAVIRHKYKLEVGPTHRGHVLDFQYAPDGSSVEVRVDGRTRVKAKLYPTYKDKDMRPLAYVEEAIHVDGGWLPPTHQSHMLAALYQHPLLPK